MAATCEVHCVLHLESSCIELVIVWRKDMMEKWLKGFAMQRGFD